MNRRDIAFRAKLVVAEVLATKVARIDERHEFRADLGADSLDMVELTARLEEEFKVRVSDDEAAFCETVGTAIDLIENKLEHQARPIVPARAWGGAR